MFEWVEDCANKDHAGAPADASPRGGDCSRRVAKGGAWYYEAEFARPSARMSFPKGSRLNVIGFRVARPLGRGFPKDADGRDKPAIAQS